VLERLARDLLLTFIHYRRKMFFNIWTLAVIPHAASTALALAATLDGQLMKGLVDGMTQHLFGFTSEYLPG